MSVQTYQTAKARLRERLGLRFEGYVHPSRELILALRGARLRHGTRPRDAMAHWLEGRQPEGMRRLPVPNVDMRSDWLFRRLDAELREHEAEHPGAKETAASGPGHQEDGPGRDTWKARLLRLHLEAAMDEIALQMIDPDWDFGPRLVDIRWPNRIDFDFTADRNGEFFAAAFACRSNLSYQIVFDDPLVANWLPPRDSSPADANPAGGPSRRQHGAQGTLPDADSLGSRRARWRSMAFDGVECPPVAASVHGWHQSLPRICGEPGKGLQQGSFPRTRGCRA